MPYTATQNVPGYLPWGDDEPPVFENAWEAWEYLAERRREQEDDVVLTDDMLTDPTAGPYSETVDALQEYADSREGPGTVYGNTPGNDSVHDLGIAYSVSEATE